MQQNKQNPQAGKKKNKKQEDLCPRAIRGKDYFIAIEGAIGVGKTSLTRLLRDRWQDSEAVFEAFETNPFLTQGFYENKEAHAFNTESFFLLTRFQQHLTHVVNKSGLILSDYMFEKNWIFGDLNLEGKDKDIFNSAYENYLPHTRNPDLVILLRADLETLLRRIYFRDREFERSLSSSYLESLMDRYYRFFASYTKAPVLNLPTTGLDFVSDPADFDKLCNYIEERINGRIQLPLDHSGASLDASL